MDMEYGRWWHRRRGLVLQSRERISRQQRGHFR